MAVITAGVVFAQNYEGEEFCQDTPSWPNGTYLGQMHPYHSNSYRGFAERRGWDPCVTWAQDQRNSAIRGIRELGYSVVEPEGGAPPPGRVVTPSVDTSSLPIVSSALDSAVWRGQVAQVRQLVAGGLNVNARTSDGDPLIREAIWRDHVEIVPLLLHAGADPDARTADGEPVAAVAAGSGATGILAMLLDAGADPHARGESGTPILVSAVVHGDAEMAHRLLEAGADPNSLAEEGFSVLALAVDRGDAAVAQLLLDAGADPNGPGIAELVRRSGNADVLALLVAGVVTAEALLALAELGLNALGSLDKIIGGMICIFTLGLGC